MSELDDRALDCLVAEKVMGWTRLQSTSRPDVIAFLSPKDRQSHYFQSRIESGEMVDVAAGDEMNAPRYSTNISAAFEVVEKMNDGPWHIVRSDHPSAQAEPYSVSFGRHGHKHSSRITHAEASAATLPRAICLAALTAVSTIEGER